jgi:hypothetical protein
MIRVGKLPQADDCDFGRSAQVAHVDLQFINLNCAATSHHRTLPRQSPPEMSDEPRKRSRFDQAEPDPPRRSKFDRRSRSPAQRDSEGAVRSRSPVAKSVETAGGPKRDAAAAAAEAAARINAQLSQKKAPQHVDVPPIRAVRPGSHQDGAAPDNSTDFLQTNSPSVAKSPDAAGDSGTLNVEIYQQDGDYIKDIEVNDLRNRYTLTKGSTQKMVNTHSCTLAH